MEEHCSEITLYCEEKQKILNCQKWQDGIQSTSCKRLISQCNDACIRCDTLKSLPAFPVEWEWHIVEGVAKGRAKNWSPYSTGDIPHQFYDDCGLSTDGTSTYLNDLEKKFPNNVKIYRKTKLSKDCDSNNAHMWRDKLEMCNAVIQALDSPCLLIQIDVDELWTADMLASSLALFNGLHLPVLNETGLTSSGASRNILTEPAMQNPKCAYFHCHFFITKDLVTITPDQYSHSNYEWLRMWVFEPGMLWLDHAPPTLAKWDAEKQHWFALANLPGQDTPCLTNAFTESHGLVFSHYAYVLPNQVSFKEHFYGYKDAYKEWASLNRKGEELLQLETSAGDGSHSAVHIADYLNWVPVGVFADTAANRVFGKDVDIVPVPLHSSVVDLSSTAEEPTQTSSRKAIHVVIDGAIFQIEQKISKGMSRVWNHLIPALANSLRPDDRITVLQRNPPYVASLLSDDWVEPPKLKYNSSDMSSATITVRTIPMYNTGGEFDTDDAMLTDVCQGKPYQATPQTFFAWPALVGNSL
jgi:hypothetical protein